MVEFNTEEDQFIIQHTDFSLREKVTYPNGGSSRFYDNGVDMVIIDDNICSHKNDESVFSYMLITDKQNNYMHMFQRVFRFLGYYQEEVDKLKRVLAEHGAWLDQHFDSLYQFSDKEATEPYMGELKHYNLGHILAVVYLTVFFISITLVQRLENNI